MMNLEIPPCDPMTKSYFEELLQKSEALYNIANKAREMGFDLQNEVEVKPASNLADRTEKIIGPPGVAKRYFEIFERTQDRTKTIFELFKEIIESKLGNLKNDQDRLEQAIKTSLMLITEGVVVAPIDGLPFIKISENSDKTKYVDLYFAGPIRAAGGTAAIFPLILGHYGATLLGLDKYKPLEVEIDRYVEENKIYHKLVSRQYKMVDDDIKHIARNCPVCINGEGTEDEEVEVNRNLPRIPTNKVRGGAMLIINEGFGLKSEKLMKFAKNLNLDWGWLDRFVKVKTSSSGKREITPIKKFLEGAAAGRPIFSYPSTFGGFRLRYGKARTTGIMGKAIHPVAMYLLDEFPAMGTQFKVERPGKSATMTSCDSMMGPAVLTDSGVKYLQKNEDIPQDIKKILFLGDYLVSVGDFRKSGHPLIPVGFCEEWWKKILQKIAEENEKLKDFVNIDANNVDPYTAVKLSEEFGLPLHPKYLFFYTQLNREGINCIKRNLQQSEKIFSDEKITALKTINDSDFEDHLIKAVIPYIKENDKIIIEDCAYPLLKTFGVLTDTPISEIEEEPLKILSFLAGFEIKDKGATFVGTRMGRPEAAKPRKMDGSPQCLFPIGKLGGSTRNVTKAADTKNQESKGLLGNSKFTDISIRLFKCPVCKDELPYVHCFKCNTKTIPQMFCNSCNRTYTEAEFKDKEKLCKSCQKELNYFITGDFDFSKIYHDALARLNIFNAPVMVKGIEGLISNIKEAEPVEKGILRSLNEVYVFKDGTVRMDLLDANLSHFKPRELNLSIEQMRILGYTQDMHGNKLENEDQIVFLFPQDVVVNTAIGNYLVKIANFIDDLLEKFYHLPKYYNVTTRNELIGHLVLGLAPHTSAGIVSRIIGYSDARVLFAHPYHNCARRRNTDGDQDSIILFLDALLNFSTRYLPKSRGGKMDAPLVATILLDPNEIDDEVYEQEICSEYPLALYEAGEKLADPYLDEIPIVKSLLKTDKQFSGIGFTHDCIQFDAGPKQSRYTKLNNMAEKIFLQIQLQDKIEAVDKKGALEMVINTHLYPDLIGNTRAYTRQQFRCGKCNTKFRRLPLYSDLKCPNCKIGNIIQTISEGSVIKYLEIAKNIVYKRDLSKYTQQRMEILEKEISSVFTHAENKQKSIGDFF